MFLGTETTRVRLPIRIRRHVTGFVGSVVMSSFVSLPVGSVAKTSFSMTAVFMLESSTPSSLVISGSDNEVAASANTDSSSSYAIGLLELRNFLFLVFSIGR